MSPESEAIFDFILALHEACNGDWTKLQAEAKVSEQSLQYFLQYATQFLGNAGNYKGFGDSKFIPRCSSDDVVALASVSAKARQILETTSIKSAIFADKEKPALMHLGFPNLGHLSAYYPDSPNISQEEIEAIGELLADKKLLPENTRLRKTCNGDYELLIASALQHPPKEGSDAGQESEWVLDGKLNGKKLRLVFGDHIEELAKIALHIKKAGLHSANETQKRMMDEYAKSFGTGSLNAFKESQKLWVKDIGPMVESNIGFIESYRDPAGVRAEWEGMGRWLTPYCMAHLLRYRSCYGQPRADQSLVSQPFSATFMDIWMTILGSKKLVDAAPSMIPRLPWSSEFEKDKFTPPDFTSLEVLSFASSGIPAGIK